MSNAPARCSGRSGVKASSRCVLMLLGSHSEAGKLVGEMSKAESWAEAGRRPAVSMSHALCAEHQEMIATAALHGREHTNSQQRCTRLSSSLCLSGSTDGGCSPVGSSTSNVGDVALRNHDHYTASTIQINVHKPRRCVKVPTCPVSIRIIIGQALCFRHLGSSRLGFEVLLGDHLEDLREQYLYRLFCR